MTFLEQQREDLDAIYSTDEFAEMITLRGVDVTALVGVPEETSEQYPNIQNVALTVSVRVSEVVAVRRGDAAVVRGTTYRVLGDPQSDRLEWYLDLEQEMVTL